MSIISKWIWAHSSWDNSAQKFVKDVSRSWKWSGDFRRHSLMCLVVLYFIVFTATWETTSLISYSKISLQTWHSWNICKYRVKNHKSTSFHKLIIAMYCYKIVLLKNENLATLTRSPCSACTPSNLPNLFFLVRLS